MSLYTHPIELQLNLGRECFCELTPRRAGTRPVPLYTRSVIENDEGVPLLTTLRYLQELDRIPRHAVAKHDSWGRDRDAGLFDGSV